MSCQFYVNSGAREQFIKPIQTQSIFRRELLNTQKNSNLLLTKSEFSEILSVKSQNIKSFSKFFEKDLSVSFGKKIIVSSDKTGECKGN